MQNARLDDSQAGFKTAGRNINNLRHGDDVTLMLMAESKEEPKSLLMKEWKYWLKTQHTKNKDHGIRSHHFTANRWGNNGNSDRLYFLGLQNHCRWWLQPWVFKRHLLLGRKAMKNLDSVLKSRDITLLTKICLVKAMVFLVVMYGWQLDHKEGWVPKNWSFWTVVLEKTRESLGLQGDPTSQS